MIDALLDFSALPNLHPAVVHFPIAFLPLALAFEAVGLLWRRQRWLAPAAATVYVLAALGAWLAVWAGERAADGLTDVAATVQPHIGEHSDWAHYAWYAIITVAVLRLAVQFLPALGQHRGARLGVLLLGLVALGVLVRAADFGGGLVFQHALAVARQAAPDEPETPKPAGGIVTGDAGQGSPTDRLTRGDDGGLVWQPAAGDGGALAEVMRAGPGSSLDAVTEVADAGGDGLVLAVDGDVTLLFPGSFAGVQVEASLELLDFTGTLGVVHHVGANGEGGAFTLDTEGSATLRDTRSGKRSDLDQAATDPAAGAVELAVSAAGRHLKGMVDGRTLVHGHIAALPPGGCGLRLDGAGRLRIRRLAVIRLDSD